MKTETKTLVDELIEKGENETIEILKTLLEKQNLFEGLSSRMMRDLKPYQPLDWAIEHFNKGNASFLYNEIQQFIETVEFISNLGWIQHTSDWDPYLIIETVRGETFQTESGYYRMETQDLETMEGAVTFELEGYEEDENSPAEEDCHVTLDIKDITKITFTR
tara:strand:+ start:220 stop:708 length:489 start_codon:yes stop_codon:yes gene_type:complete